MYRIFSHPEANADSPDLDPKDTTAGFSLNLVIGGMSEEAEDSGTVIKINADFDEKNRNAAGNPLADYQPDEKEGHRIVGDDPNLLDGSLFIKGSGKGEWRLIFPESVKIWRKEEGSKYEEIISSRFSNRNALCFSALY